MADELERLEREGGRKKLSQADKLILLCLGKKPELFHDHHNTPFCRIQQSDVKVTMPIKSRPFRAWLSKLLWEDEEKAPSTEGVYGAINVLEAMAFFEGKEYVLYNRVAPGDEGFWIDMADDKWRAIHVTAKGWRIVEDPPILFKRYSHQKPLVEPVAGGDPWTLLDFMNVNAEDKATRLVLMCAVVSYLIPQIPHVILVLHGIQGSGKTMLFKLVRSLIDPSSVDVLSMPRNEKERVQQLDHHWCAFYDNITGLPTWISDTLCRAATGGGFTKRELYTDDDDIIYNFKRCVGLNGINIAAQRGDLLDRSLLVGLADISKEKRRTEAQLLAEFEGCKAEILGGVLDALVKAIQHYPHVQPDRLFRMADFTRWGCAIALGLGKTANEFLDAYEAKVRDQIKEAAHASPVATVLLDFVEGRVKWEGTPTNLHVVLTEHAKMLNISTRQKAWPKAPHILSRKLNELIPSLKQLGVDIVTNRKGEGRIISITADTSVTSVTPPSNDDGGDATDGSSITSSGRHDRVIDNSERQQPCASCRKTPDKLYPDDSGIFLICKECKLGERKK